MQPTNEELRERVEYLEEKVRKLEEKQTEPLRIARVEIDSAGMQDLLKQNTMLLERLIHLQSAYDHKLDTLERNHHELKQELYTLSHGWLDALQENENHRQADHANVKATLSDHGETLKHMATKDDITALKAEGKHNLSVMESRINENISTVRANMSTMESRILTAMKQMLQENK
jgi:hypothetical protein